MSDPHNCRVIRQAEAVESTDTKQELPTFVGVSGESVGAAGICMHLGTIPPRSVAQPHIHEGHESAIYILSGQISFYYGPDLEHLMTVGPGDFVYLGASVPHQPFNESDTETARYIVARTDPNEQESVVVLPELWRRMANHPLTASSAAAG